MVVVIRVGLRLGPSQSDGLMPYSCDGPELQREIVVPVALSDGSDCSSDVFGLGARLFYVNGSGITLEHAAIVTWIYRIDGTVA
jgi:hypothetical protein